MTSATAPFPRTAALALLVLVSPVSLGGQTPSSTGSGDGGVVVEEVGLASSLEKAGIRPGDILLSWEQLATAPVNPEGSDGEITSPFDWMWLKAEQAPRGTLKLVGRRGAAKEVFEVAPGPWDGRVRARLAGAQLEGYGRGKKLLEAEGLEAAMGAWQTVAEGLGADGVWRCWMLFRMAELQAEARNWHKTQALYRSALELAEGPRARVAIWQAIATAHQAASELDEAIEAFQSARELGERAWGTKSLSVAASLSELGNLAWRRGDLDRASGYLTQALEIQQQLAPHSFDVALSVNGLGVVAFYRGQLDRAHAYFTQVLEIRQTLAPGSLRVAHSLNNLGLFERERGDLDLAEDHLSEALEVLQQLKPDSLDVARSLNNLGNLAWRRGELNRAGEYIGRALELRQKLAPDSLELARSLHSLGALARLRGDSDRAEDYFTQALAIQQRLAPRSLELSSSLSGLAAVASGLGDQDRAADYFAQVLEIQEKQVPGSSDVALSLRNLGVVERQRGDLDRAAAYLTQALEMQQQLAPDSIDVAKSLNILGTVARQLGDVDGAAGFLTQALEIQQRLAPMSSEEASTLHELGRLAQERHQLRVAGSFLDRALESLEGQFGKLGGSPDSQAGYRARHRSYYQAQIEVQLELEQAAEAFHTLERSRAQSFLAELAERDLLFHSDIPEQLDRERRRANQDYDRTLTQLTAVSPLEVEAREELNQKLQTLRRQQEDLKEKIRSASPRLAALTYPEPLDLSATRRLLAPGTLLLAYSIGEEKSFVFAVGAGAEELAVVELAVNEETLRREVERFRGLLDPSQKRSTIDRLARQLSEKLLRPVAAQVAKAERLVVLPDGPLHYLPFAVLIAPAAADGPRYLVEEAPISVVASATVLGELQQRGRAPGELRVSAFGDPHYPGFDGKDDVSEPELRSVLRSGWELGPIPATRAEVESLEELFPESTRLYLGEEATEEAVKALGSDVSILHFACHGVMNERFPMESALALTIPERWQEGQDNGLLQVWEIFEQVRIDADLVTLSACETGLGNEMGGEGIVGLTRAFQYAGARSVLASLWEVSDVSTVELMRRFYRYLKEGQEKNEALRLAQVDFIRGEAGRSGPEARSFDFAHPFYWAAFELVGNWQ